MYGRRASKLLRVFRVCVWEIMRLACAAFLMAWSWRRCIREWPEMDGDKAPFVDRKRFLSDPCCEVGVFQL